VCAYEDELPPLYRRKRPLGKKSKKRPRKEPSARTLAKRPSKGTMERDLKKRPTKETYMYRKRDIYEWKKGYLPPKRRSSASTEEKDL